LPPDETDKRLIELSPKGGKHLLKAKLVLKLGGSAITKKDSPFTPNLEAIDRIALEIAQLIGGAGSGSVILVYGGGSFGHPVAVKHLANGVVHDAFGVAEIRGAMLNLSKIITDAFLKRGVPIFVINPSSSMTLSIDGEPSDGPWVRQVELCLERGLVPALGGDVVIDISGSARILSGDVIARRLAKAFGASLLAFGTDVDGVMMDGQVVKEVAREDLPVLIARASGREGDVTGGMAGKLREIEKYMQGGGGPALIFNATKPGSVAKLLGGGHLEGTYIR